MATLSDAHARHYFSSVWSNRFIIAAIVQGAAITGVLNIRAISGGMAFVMSYLKKLT